MATVELQSIQKRFGTTTIIPNLDLEIRSGEFVALVGPSGCGKSTLLRMVAGLEDPTSGILKIDGKVVNEISPKDRGIAMVFQNYALYPHMSVRENLGFALKMAKVNAKEIETRVGETAEILGLGALLHRKPSELSGGQKQRVAMGRAMVRRPKVLLFDEPLSNLDAQLRIKVRAEIAQLHQQIRSTVIYVTHDQVEAMTLADRIAVLNKGTLEQCASPLEIYHQPKTQFVASFIGTPPMNFISIPTTPHHVGVRPEHTFLKDTGDGNRLKMGSGRVSLIEPLGRETHVHVKVGDQMVVAELKGTETPPVWDQGVDVYIDSSHLFYFDSKGARVNAPV